MDNSNNSTLTILTPPDRYYGADINILVSGFTQAEHSELILVLDNIDMESCLCLYDLDPTDNIDWLLDTAQKCSIIILNLKCAMIDTKSSIFYGWLLSKNNCYYMCDDNLINLVSLINTHRIESILDPIREYQYLTEE